MTAQGTKVALPQIREFCYTLDKVNELQGEGG